MATVATSPAGPSSASTAVDYRLVDMLLNDDVWHPSAPPRASSAATLTAQERKAIDDELYLRDKVMPTLVPALHDLCELVQREHDHGTHARPSSVCVSKANPTGASGPIQWLAQYLARNNTMHSDSLATHPYGVLSRTLDESATPPPPTA